MGSFATIGDALGRRWESGPFAKKTHAALVLKAVQPALIKILGEVAEFIEPLVFDGGTLTIGVREVSVLSQLRTKSDQIVFSLQQSPELKTIETIHFQLF